MSLQKAYENDCKDLGSQGSGYMKVLYMIINDPSLNTYAAIVFNVNS
jgi:hypothetical protein